MISTEMPDELGPYTSARPAISQEDINAVVSVLKSGHLEEGELVRRFEALVSTRLKKQYSQATVNGFSSIHTLLLSLGIGKGDEVIIPSYCCPAVLFPVKLTGATPVFADIEDGSFSMSAETIATVFTSRTKVILFPYQFGFPGGIDEVVRQFPQSVIIEDVAQAFGATLGGEPLGSFTDHSICSFYASKMITSGDGGMLLTNNEEVYDRARQLVYYGGQTGQQETGFNYHLTNLNAALGMSQVSQINKFIEMRRKLAAGYSQVFSGHDVMVSTFAYSSDSCYLKYPVLLPDKPTRDKLRVALKAAGIGTGLGVLEALHVKEESAIRLPRTELYIDRILCLPIYPDLTIKDIHYIAEKTLFELRKIL